MKIREMREEEDIDDYFRIFEMTAKAQSLPESEWVGNLVPKLTEKAKSIYLEIPDPKCQNYHESKTIIIKAYQLNHRPLQIQISNFRETTRGRLCSVGESDKKVFKSLHGSCRGCW